MSDHITASPYPSKSTSSGQTCFIFHGGLKRFSYTAAGRLITSKGTRDTVCLFVCRLKEQIVCLRQWH